MAERCPEEATLCLAHFSPSTVEQIRRDEPDYGTDAPSVTRP
jgi:hypothetical protein